VFKLLTDITYSIFVLNCIAYTLYNTIKLLQKAFTFLEIWMLGIISLSN